MNNHIKYETIGQRIGSLVDRKNAKYGDSIHVTGKMLKLLYPNGIKLKDYDNVATLVRMFDKMKRIATDNDEDGENPYKDIAGYGILNCEEDKSESKADI
jgi:hypothetical protein